VDLNLLTNDLRVELNKYFMLGLMMLHNFNECWEESTEMFAGKDDSSARKFWQKKVIQMFSLLFLVFCRETCVTSEYSLTLLCFVKQCKQMTLYHFWKSALLAVKSSPKVKSIRCRINLKILLEYFRSISWIYFWLNENYKSERFGCDSHWEPSLS